MEEGRCIFQREQMIRETCVLLFTDNEAIMPWNHSCCKSKYHVIFTMCTDRSVRVCGV